MDATCVVALDMKLLVNDDGYNFGLTIGVFVLSTDFIMVSTPQSESEGSDSTVTGLPLSILKISPTDVLFMVSGSVSGGVGVGLIEKNQLKEVCANESFFNRLGFSNLMCN